MKRQKAMHRLAKLPPPLPPARLAGAAVWGFVIVMEQPCCIQGKYSLS